MEQPVANVSPRTLLAGPGPEQLNRITIRLGPPSVELKSLVQTPAQVAHELTIAQNGRLARAGSSGSAHSAVPPDFPVPNAEVPHRVNVGRTADLVMAEDPRPELDCRGISRREARLLREAIEDALQLPSQFACHQYRSSGRDYSVVSALGDRHQTWRSRTSVGPGRHRRGCTNNARQCGHPPG
jgi:hypothetical protein